jgi:hypothetical protein
MSELERPSTSMRQVMSPSKFNAGINGSVMPHFAQSESASNSSGAGLQSSAALGLQAKERIKMASARDGVPACLASS